MDATGPLVNAGRGVRAEIRRAYPDPEEAVAAVREAMKDLKAVEGWASVVEAKGRRMEGEAMVRPFSFDELPAGMRGEALECLAAAMVAWTCEQERRRAS